MKRGDLVKCHPDVYGDVNQTGIVIEVINSQRTAPPVCKVMWAEGDVEQHWTDDLEVISEGQ